MAEWVMLSDVAAYSAPSAGKRSPEQSKPCPALQQVARYPKMLSSCGKNWENPVSGAGWGPGEALRMLWLIFSTSASSAARVPQEMRLRLGIIQVPAQKVRTSRRKSIQMRSRSLSPAQPDATHRFKHQQRSALQGFLQACCAADCTQSFTCQAELLLVKLQQTLSFRCCLSDRDVSCMHCGLSHSRYAGRGARW